jgi:hypothetical protein
VNDEFKDLEGKGLGPIEIILGIFSGETEEYHKIVNHIILASAEIRGEDLLNIL